MSKLTSKNADDGKTMTFDAHHAFTKTAYPQLS